MAQFVKRFKPGNPSENAKNRTNEDLEGDNEFDKDYNDNIEIDIDSDFIINIEKSQVLLKCFCQKVL